MTILVINQEQVAQLLPMQECIGVMRAALKTLALGDAVLPLRLVMRLPDQRSAFAVMPSYLGSPKGIAAKVISVFPANEGTAFDSHQGAVLLFEAEHGSLVAVIDATAITAIRTAAVSGVATDLLARKDAGDLAILGSGTQARTHLDAMHAVRKLRRVRVWSPNVERLKGFITWASSRIGMDVEPGTSARDAVEGADIVCTATSSREPVLAGRWLAPGAHVNAVGSSVRTARELDSDAVTRARLYVDRRESTLAEAGDFLVPKAEGRFGDEHIRGEIGDLLLDRVDGRASASDITLFKSLGIAIEDLAAAHHIHQKAMKLGIGTTVDFGGARH